MATALRNSFYESAEVLFISTHQYPHYPGSGGIREVGHGAGEGYTVNVPLSGGAGDKEYITVFHKLVAPLLEAFRPELILVSAGFDAHESDPLGGMNLTENGYENMLQILMHVAAECCDERLILTLEGGYNLTALRNSTKRILYNLSAYNPQDEAPPPLPESDQLKPLFSNRLRDVMVVHQKYWPVLQIF